MNEALFVGGLLDGKIRTLNDCDRSVGRIEVVDGHLRPHRYAGKWILQYLPESSGPERALVFIDERIKGDRLADMFGEIKSRIPSTHWKPIEEYGEHEADLMEDMIEYAKHRSWDCFKGDGK
jgi:hypothetical protein